MNDMSENTRTIGERGESLNFSSATRAVNITPDLDRLAQYDEYPEKLRRQKRTNLLWFAIFAAPTVALIYKGFPWWSIIPGILAVWNLFWFIAHRNASPQAVYEKGLLCGAVVVSENPLQIAVMAQMQTADDDPVCWGVQSFDVKDLPAQKITKGERVPCAVLFSGMMPFAGVWGDMSPHPLCWATGDKAILENAKNAIDENEWKTLETLAKQAAEREDIDFTKKIAYFNEDLSPRTNLQEKPEKVETEIDHKSDAKKTHVADWDFYICESDDVSGSITLDLGLKEIAPVAEKSNLIRFLITMQKPREDGMPNNDENERLLAIEENVVNNLSSSHDAIFAGRFTSEGKRQLFFYVGDTQDCRQTVEATMSKYSTYEFEFHQEEDKKWECYLKFLYPAPHEYQIIMNGRQMRILEEQGDDASKERLVDHWIYFKTEADMQKFTAEIKKHNFEIISSKQDEEKIFVMNVGRMDNIEYHSVNDYVLYLWALAAECNGMYDGWGCPIVRK